MLSDAGRRRLVVKLCAVGLVFMAMVLTRSRGLWAPDELRYAQVVQGMIEHGDWFAPRLWDGVYTEKPPLYFWFVAALAPFTAGVHLSTLLVPVVVSGACLVGLTSVLAARWHGERAGLFAAPVLASLPLFLLMASIGRMDMLLALCVTAAIAACFRGYVEGDRLQRVLAFGWMGCGALAKGPFGVVFPLAVAGTALLCAGKIRRLACRETWFGCAVLAAILSLWLVPGTISAGGGYFHELISRQLVARAVVGVSHAQPVYFYLWLAPLMLLPWLVFFAPAVTRSWRLWRERCDDREIWLLCWLGVPLVVLSLVREKTAFYLLPIMPPVALLIGRYVAESIAACRLCAGSSWRIRALFGGLGTAGLFAVALAMLCRPDPSSHDVTIGPWFRFTLEGDIVRLLLRPSLLLAAGVVLSVLAVTGWFGIQMRAARAVRAAFGSLTATTVCGHLFVVCIIMPALDRAHSWRAVADAIRSAQQTGEPVLSYGVPPFAAYYVRDGIVWIKNRESLRQIVGRSGAVWCATRPDKLDAIRRQCVVETNDDWCYPTPTDPVVLVRLRPGGLAAAGSEQRFR